MITKCQQCTAIASSTGSRCKLQTCKFSPFCHFHTYVKVAKSSIPNAGDGAFAKKAIPNNTKIADYTVGTLPLSRQGLDLKYFDRRITHVWQKNNNLYYDATVPPANSIAGKFNTCRPQDKRAGKCPGNNAKINANGNIKTSKKIAQGSEIFVSGYGRHGPV